MTFRRSISRARRSLSDGYDISSVRVRSQRLKSARITTWTCRPSTRG